MLLFLIMPNNYLAIFAKSKRRFLDFDLIHKISTILV